MKNKILNNVKGIISENFKFWEVIILMFLTMVVGISVGNFFSKKTNLSNYNGKYSTDLQEFINTYEDIINNYYGELDESKLLGKALQTVLSQINDPYAAYMDEASSNNLNIQLAGNYRGIGVEVATLKATNELVVSYVFDDSPAENVGIKTGDIFYKLNGKTINGMSGLELSNKIKNYKGEFTLTVLRNNEELDFNITLDSVVLKSVSSNMIDDEIGYLYISVFADNTYEQLNRNLAELKNSGMKSLIIDLRSNTGGYLTSVDKTLSLFLDSSHVIYQLQDKTNVTKFYSSGRENVDYNIVLLTNGSTASAAEIMTAALKEELGAVSVGEKTFGKGSAQKLHTLNNGTKYKFTTQKWLTPKGNSIDKVGIDVDYNVELNSSYQSAPFKENDNQLQCAIQLLKDK